MPPKHEASIQIVTQCSSMQNNMNPLKVKVFPDDGKYGLEFLMCIVTTQFDSTLNIDNLPREDLFKVWN